MANLYKRLATIFVTLVLSNFFPFGSQAPVAAANPNIDATLGFSQSSYSGDVGSSLSADLVVNTGSNGLSIVSVSFNYPTDKMRFLSADYQGTQFPLVIREASDASGTVTLTRANIDAGGYRGTQGLVARLNFTLVSAGSGLLQISQELSDLRDYQYAENVLSQVSNATITVNQVGGGAGGGGQTGGGGSSGSGGTSNKKSSGGSNKNSGSGSNQTNPTVTTLPDTTNFHNFVVQAFADKAIVSWDSPHAYTYQLKYGLADSSLEGQTISSDQPNTLFQAILPNLESCKDYSVFVTLLDGQTVVETRLGNFTTLGCDLALPDSNQSKHWSPLTVILLSLGATFLLALIGLSIRWAVRKLRPL